MLPLLISASDCCLICDALPGGKFGEVKGDCSIACVCNLLSFLGLPGGFSHTKGTFPAFLCGTEFNSDLYAGGSGSLANGLSVLLLWSVSEANVDENRLTDRSG